MTHVIEYNKFMKIGFLLFAIEYSNISTIELNISGIKMASLSVLKVSELGLVVMIYLAINFLISLYQFNNEQHSKKIASGEKTAAGILSLTQRPKFLFCSLEAVRFIYLPIFLLVAYIFAFFGFL